MGIWSNYIAVDTGLLKTFKPRTKDMMCIVFKKGSTWSGKKFKKNGLPIKSNHLSSQHMFHTQRESLGQPDVPCTNKEDWNNWNISFNIKDCPFSSAMLWGWGERVGLSKISFCNTSPPVLSGWWACWLLTVNNDTVITGEMTRRLILIKQLSQSGLDLSPYQGLWLTVSNVSTMSSVKYPPTSLTWQSKALSVFPLTSSSRLIY